MTFKMLIPAVAVLILLIVFITGDEIPTDRQAKDSSNDAIVFRADAESITDSAYKQLRENLPQIIKLAKENGRKLQECNKKLETLEQVVELYENCREALHERDSDESDSDEETCDKIIDSLQNELKSLKNKTKECEELRERNKKLEKRVRNLEQEITMYKEAASMFNSTEIEIHNALMTCMDDAVICSQELRSAQQGNTNLAMENSALQFSRDDCKRYNDGCQNDLSTAVDYKKTCLRDLTFCNMSLNYCVSRNDLCRKMVILFDANQEDGRINKLTVRADTDTESDEEDEMKEETA